MLLWTALLDLLRVVLFAFAHVCGGSLGGGIIVLSLMIRLALLPLTLRMAARARAYQRALKTLEPALEKLKQRHAADPLAFRAARLQLYAANGLGAAPKGMVAGTFVQAPLGIALYQTVGSIAKRAVRFLWIHDLSRPDAVVASVAAGLAGAAVMAGPVTPTSRLTATLAAAGTFLLAWRLSAGVGLYWVASNVVGVVQSVLVRRAAGNET